MKDILVLLVLLIFQLTEVCPQPSSPDSNGKCPNESQYLSDISNLCCSKCQPGQRLLRECSESTDSVCTPCDPEQYMEGWNYAQNCFSCPKCKSSKGQEYARNCSATTKSKCKCMPGWYCTMKNDYQHCTVCEKYKLCKAGYGVSKPGTENSNVKCKHCPDGMFSDKESYTEPCQTHTNCNERAVVRKGNATSDTVCEPSGSSTEPQNPTKESHTVLMITSTRKILPFTPAQGPVNSTVPVDNTTKSPQPGLELDLVAAICGVTAVILLFFTIILVYLCKSICKKDAERLHPKVDANGNCENGDKINHGYMGETQLISFVSLPEQQCLLEKGEASSDYSQCSNNTETLTRTEGCSSHESIGPLQSTLALNNPSSALSEPLPLISNTDAVISQPSNLTQSSSQPTSPQIISPVTTSPHVNVNITFHIGNGSCGTPSVMPTDLIQADCKLPLGEEEGSFSIPQQEDGKQSLMSVQESTCYSV